MALDPHVGASVDLGFQCELDGRFEHCVQSTDSTSLSARRALSASSPGLLTTAGRPGRPRAPTTPTNATTCASRAPGTCAAANTTTWRSGECVPTAIATMGFRGELSVGPVPTVAPVK